MAAAGPAARTPRPAAPAVAPVVPTAVTAAPIAAPPAPGQNMSIPRSVVWTFEEDCRLENALAQHWANVNKLQLVAAMLPHKDINAVRRRFAMLEQDIASIEAGRVPLPAYPGSAEPLQIQTAGKKKSSAPAPDERRKGVPWSEEEHRLFLQGLEIYGKGDWRSISRKCVLTRNPTQVASHAQKYFIRLNSMNKKDKRRSSIHDITTPAAAAGVHGPAMSAMQQQQGHPQAPHHPGAAIMGPGLPHAGVAMAHGPAAAAAAGPMTSGVRAGPEPGLGLGLGQP